MNKIELLDCTLRDGAYICNSEFGSPAIKGIIKKLQDAKIKIIECGWLKNSAYREGSTYYHHPDDLCQYLVDKNRDVIYVAMIDWDRYDLTLLPGYDGNSIDAIRVVFPHGKHKEGIEVGERIKDKGYRVFYQAANTLAYSDTELIRLTECVNSAGAEALSVVDTFGAMFSEDVARIGNIICEYLDEKISIGFHSHNNQQMAFSNTVTFCELMNKKNRDCILDSTLCGMGRGAGNATTELMVNYLNKYHDCNYDMNYILESWMLSIYLWQVFMKTTAGDIRHHILLLECTAVMLIIFHT